MRRVVLTLCCVLLFAGNALALTGNDWKTFEPLYRTIYVMGVWDDWQSMKTLNEAFFDNKDLIITTLFSPIMECTTNRMTYEQMRAIVDKYLVNNPEKWHQEMSTLMWAALMQACSPEPTTTTSPTLKKEYK